MLSPLTPGAVSGESKKPMPEQQLKPLPPLILASGSPRRKELLASLGLQFDVVPSQVDEEAIDVSGLTPAEVVCRLASEKAADVAQRFPGHLVLGSDTVVVLEGEIFGKPKDRQAAFEMLSRLQGAAHQVYTGVTLCYQGERLSEAVATDVVFKALSQEAIWRYVDTKEPMDKAGAYAIQGLGSLNVERINGCYFNVVGLPVAYLQTMVARLGFSFP